MRNKIFVITLTLIALMALSTLAQSADMQKAPMKVNNTTCITMSQEDLKLKMRMLWYEHVTWTRLFI